MRKSFLSLLLVVIVSFVVATTPVHAASLTEAQIKAIVSLLQSFGAEPAVITNVNASLRGEPSPAPTETAVPATAVTPTTTATPVETTQAPLPEIVPATSAPSVSEQVETFEITLRIGASGDDVERLQIFLSQFPDIYPEKRVTGSFGPLTQRALERFQKKHGIVSSGRPETTGYGLLGSRTRAKINELLTEGAGRSGVVPPGLLRAPGLSEVRAGTQETTATPQQYVISCSDTDNGINYEKYGSVAVTYNTGGGTQYNDGCFTAYNSKTGVYESKNAEYYCESGQMKRIEAECSDSCKINTLGGLCTVPSQPVTSITPAPTQTAVTPATTSIATTTPTTTTTTPPPTTTTTTTTTTTATSTTDTIAPSIPTNLSATTISSSQINLSWSASTDAVGVVGYRVYRAGNEIAKPTSTSYSDTGLSATTVYSYTVAAYDAAGNVSLQSASVSATTQSGTTATTTPSTDSSAPTIPSGLSATAVSSSQINLAWNVSIDNVGVAGYRLYKDGALLTSVTTTSYSNTGLSAHTTYSYTVLAYDAAGNVSAQSNPVTAITLVAPVADTTPAVISNIQVTNIGTDSATVTWTTNEPADSKVVFTGPINKTVTDGASITSHSLTATGLHGGALYSYIVTSVDSSGNTVSSSAQTFTTVTPGGSTMISCTDTDGGINYGTYGKVTVCYTTGGCTENSDGCFTSSASGVAVSKNAEYFCEGTQWKRAEAQCVASCSTTTAGGICPIAQATNQTKIGAASIQINLSAASVGSDYILSQILQKIKEFLR